jgi:hypothetical protein
MRTALDADPVLLDRHEQDFVDKVRKHGWFHTSVAPSSLSDLASSKFLSL